MAAYYCNSYDQASIEVTMRALFIIRERLLFKATRLFKSFIIWKQDIWLAEYSRVSYLKINNSFKLSTAMT